MLLGFCAVEDDGDAPGKFHCHDVGLLVLKSVKFAHPGSHITVGVPEKFATGTLQFCTTTVDTAVAEHPDVVPVTVYEVVAAGAAVTLAPVVGETPELHEYVEAPLAVKFTGGSPAHMVAEVTVTFGTALIVIVELNVVVGQPEVEMVFVTVYVPGVLPARFTSPVLVLTNTNPAGDALNVPAVPPPE